MIDHWTERKRVGFDDNGQLVGTNSSKFNDCWELLFGRNGWWESR